MAKSPNRALGAAFGAAYVLVGLFGFFGFFVTESGLLLGIFQVNTFQNVAHIIIGAVLLLVMVSTVKTSRRINSVVGAALLLLGLAGLFLIGTPVNILALNAANNVLHFGSAAVLLAVGLGAEKRTGTLRAA